MFIAMWFGQGTMIPDVMVGDIAFSGKYKPSPYSRIVMWVTRSRWSHAFLVTGEIFGQKAVLESELSVVTVLFDEEYRKKKVDYYEVFRPIAEQNLKYLAAQKTFYKYSGVDYGFLSIPWFLWRALCSKVGIKVKRNWSSSGCFCSELVYDYIHNLGGYHMDLLDGFTEDTASPEDIYQLVKSRPDLFQPIGGRD